MSEIQPNIDANKKTLLFGMQITRKDVLANMLSNTQLKGEELFDLIINDNNQINNESRKGWLFETLCQILIILKCIKDIHYTELIGGQLQHLVPIRNINSLLALNVAGGGNNVVDMSIKQENTLILFTIKYKKRFGETDVSKIDNTMTSQKIAKDYKIGLIVKDKEMYSDHRYHNNLNIDKQIHDKIRENRLLFDKKDIIQALDVFCDRFREKVLEIEGFIDFINAEYLLSPRQQLIKKLHQQMTENKFVTSFLKNKHKMWCIAHKPRSGKSITILSICKYLLENGYKKILIITSVPATINSFVDNLDKYIDFSDIKYKLQDKFNTVDDTFYGIVFCSVQYLKVDKNSTKKNLLKKIGFDAIFTDESHQGSSTDKTRTQILEVDSDVEELRTSIKLNIFSSGTSEKTKKYYGIHSSCIYEWEIEDESFMKQLIKPEVRKKEEIIDYMVRRHGNTFTDCLKNHTLNNDYSKCPTQVLMKHSIPESLIVEINNYNAVHKTNFGYNCSSLFALQSIINEKGEVEYAEEFEICRNNDGIQILKGFFDCIISKNRMNNTIMKQLENTQTNRGSRKSTNENPLLFIVYLPTHTRNNTISLLQKTFKKFLETHNLWSNYNVEYSNSKEDTGNVKEEYNEYIKTIMNNTKSKNKNGCILLLGNKGSVGITYPDCDVTISLDDGHHLDNQKQRYSRALTEADGKTIGINIDMNIQRTYLYLIDIVQKHRKTTKTNKTNAQILYYLFEHNIFLFDPQNINNGKMTQCEIMSYYEQETKNIMKEIDDTPFLEHLICNDDMRDFIKMDFHRREFKKMNKDLDGEQPHCPKGDTTAVQVDAPYVVDDEEKKSKLDEQETVKIELLINQTYEMCKSFLFPLLALISRSYKIFDFKEIFTSEKTGGLIMSLLKVKNIDLNKNNYIIIVNIMNNIIDNNIEIVNNIREIYSIAPANKLRELIEKHFIPTCDEKKKNAEVPTPVKLVDEMLNSIPESFWKKPQKVFEPCCGKGNFILGIFDRFYKGLEEMYINEIERCHVIMTECIFYADINPLNIFITTELLKCHIQIYTGLENVDYEFNKYIGDTTKISIQDEWNINGFDLVCGNPPYNASGDTATGNTIWQDFSKNGINKWLLSNGYLLFVHPPGWRKPNTARGKFTKMFELMTKENQMIYLEIHGIKDGQKVFKCGTRYDWYLIKKTRQSEDTIVVDQNENKIKINLSELSWLPNSNILEIKKLLAKEDDKLCPIMYDRTAYGADKRDRMSTVQTQEFKYPCVHSTPKAGIRYMYSKFNNRGHFGEKKVIFGESGINNPIIDMDGKYGMTHGAMAIKVDDLAEAQAICKVIESKEFNSVIQSCVFSSYRIDWNIFKEFKKDFYKEFLKEKEE